MTRASWHSHFERGQTPTHKHNQGASKKQEALGVFISRSTFFQLHQQNTVGVHSLLRLKQNRSTPLGLTKNHSSIFGLVLCRFSLCKVGLFGLNGWFSNKKNKRGGKKRKNTIGLTGWFSQKKPGETQKSFGFGILFPVQTKRRRQGISSVCLRPPRTAASWQSRQPKLFQLPRGLDWRVVFGVACPWWF